MPISFRLRDAFAALVVCGLAVAAIVPAVARSREAARGRQCMDNLRAIGVALRQYHTAQGTLPPAAVWNADATNTLMLFSIKRIDRVTQANWAQLLLPYLGRGDVATMFDQWRLVMDPINARARETHVVEFACPTDRFNTPHNPYTYQPTDDAPPIASFARGNYAINGGTQSTKYMPESTTQPRGESMRIVLDREPRLFQAVGLGIAGINHAFRLADFTQGQSTLVAFDEIRAGVNPFDTRGAWALGQIGASITWAHGVVGDDCGPNNQLDRSDDILGGDRLHDVMGAKRLQELRMPCCPYIDANQEATARSQHPGGVNVLFLDGAARFVCDEVDHGVWHVMHSRETPAKVLHGLHSKLESPAAESASGTALKPPRRAPAEPGNLLTNSLGMRFVGIRAGSVVMGIADENNDDTSPPECPPHEVTISRAFWLGRCEVTQAQYRSVLADNPSEHRSDRIGLESTDDFPVENVTWGDAARFCRRLSELPEEKAAGRSYRLPTEAEWEYACRSGKSQRYRWNRTRRADDASGDAAGIEPPLPVAKVGSYPPNGFGLYDMRGNVWEWCADWFDRSYYSRSARVDPQGPAEGYLKVVRGSDWLFVGELCRINYPIMSPWRKSPFVGFRVVCECNE